MPSSFQIPPRRREPPHSRSFHFLGQSTSNDQHSGKNIWPCPNLKWPQRVTLVPELSVGLAKAITEDCIAAQLLSPRCHFLPLSSTGVGDHNLQMIKNFKTAFNQGLSFLNSGPVQLHMLQALEASSNQTCQ